MRLQGAVIREQGVKFAVVVVKGHIVQSTSRARETIQCLTPTFGGIPVVLMAQDSRGRPTYIGRTDIVRFLRNVPISAIPWRKYTIS